MGKVLRFSRNGVHVRILGDHVAVGTVTEERIFKIGEQVEIVFWHALLGVLGLSKDTTSEQLREHVRAFQPAAA